ncbi:MAG TPA: hypothetical protein VFN67_08400 [Polyangiales bacterium]|nr:hypothetical protein [Polyangiales bacterium]
MAPVALSALYLAAPGCSFGEGEADMEQNTCQVDSDCSTQHCDSGRCVAEAERAMDVTLVVTPKRAPRGGQALPIVSESFGLSGGSQTIALRMPVAVPVRVVYKNKPLSAQASFTPIDNDNRFLAKTTTLSLLGGDNDDVATVNKTLLLDGMTYRVVIQPSDVRIPPHSLLFTAQSDAELAVDYADVEEQYEARRFLVKNASRLSYQVRAISEVTGAPISDTTTFNGSLSSLSSFTLRFDDADAPYRLEFAPAEKQSYSTGVAGSCGDDTPQPNLKVPSRLFKADLTTDNRWYVELPLLHPAVEYSGVVALCSNQKLTADLQITLETHDLYLASGDSEKISGDYETAAAASWDPELNKFRFCARVPPGTYTVSVKPSPTLDCEVFAEKRVLRPDWSGQDELGLRMPAVLTANVLTPDRMPMAKATVDVQAQTSGELMRAPEDRTVANYNRSASVTTGNDGSFTLSVDRGRYDVYVKPPETSNYAWRVIYDVAIAAANAEFATEIMLSEPVAVTGKLQYIDGSSADQQSLADAEVRAYTLVNVEGKAAEQRSVQIGVGVANASGTVTLLLPPALQHSWNP